MPTNKEEHQRMRDDLAHYDCSVLSCDREKGKCQGCQGVRPIFQCHIWRPGPSRVIARCKSCLQEEFGDRIYIKQLRGNGLGITWDLDTHRVMPSTQSSRHKGTRQDETRGDRPPEP